MTKLEELKWRLRLLSIEVCPWNLWNIEQLEQDPECKAYMDKIGWSNKTYPINMGDPTQSFG